MWTTPYRKGPGAASSLVARCHVMARIYWNDPKETMLELNLKSRFC